MTTHWNRAARKSGGDRRAEIPLPTLTHEDVEILAMEARIRHELGEDGVERFREMLAERQPKEPRP